VITCADVMVNRYLFPGTPIGRDSTKENLQLASANHMSRRHTRLSDTAKKHIPLEMLIYVMEC